MILKIWHANGICVSPHLISAQQGLTFTLGRLIYNSSFIQQASFGEKNDTSNLVGEAAPPPTVAPQQPNVAAAPVVPSGVPNEGRLGPGCRWWRTRRQSKLFAAGPFSIHTLGTFHTRIPNRAKAHDRHDKGTDNSG